MTFGALISTMKEQWQLHPALEQFLDEFLQERNTFVHRLTTLDGFGLVRKRDRERLERRVDRFLDMAFAANQLFSAAQDASLSFAQNWLKEHKGIDVGVEFPEHAEREITSFLALVDLKPRVKP